MTTSGGGGSSGGAGSAGGGSSSAGGADSGGSSASGGSTAGGTTMPSAPAQAEHGHAATAGVEHASTAEVAGILQEAGTRWSAATVGTGAAEDLQRASGTAVMTIGSRAGGNAGPSLAQFQRYVASGQVHYFVTGAAKGGATRSGGGSAQIERWVAENYKGEEVGALTVYDLTKPPSGRPAAG
jgi:hypothetical protein